MRLFLQHHDNGHPLRENAGFYLDIAIFTVYLVGNKIRERLSTKEKNNSLTIVNG